MALDFPTSPTVGQQYGGYVFDGTKWKVSTTSTAPASVQPTPPTNPTAGDMWFNSTDGTMYFYYNDGNTSQWVESRAPIVANGYYSPNYIINGGFDIWQRGNSGSLGYVADRWSVGGTGTVSTTRSTDIPNVSGLSYSISIAQTSGTYPLFFQRIESLQAASFAGKSVTLSFWAKSSAGTQGLAFQANLPAGVDNWSSSPVDYSAVFTPSMTVGTWTKYTATWTASASAKNGYQIYIYRDVASSSTTTTLFAGVQLEEGTVATSFRRNANSIQGELAACQRYYWRIVAEATNGVFGVGNCLSTALGIVLRCPVPMRGIPSAVETTGVMANYLGNSYTGSNQGVTSISIDASLTSSTSVAINANLATPTADKPFRLTSTSATNTYLGFSAEL